jgi:hypothetical protein
VEDIIALAIRHRFGFLWIFVQIFCSHAASRALKRVDAREKAVEAWVDRYGVPIDNREARRTT